MKITLLDEVLSSGFFEREMLQADDGLKLQLIFLVVEKCFVLRQQHDGKRHLELQASQGILSGLEYFKLIDYSADSVTQLKRTKKLA